MEKFTISFSTKKKKTVSENQEQKTNPIYRYSDMKKKKTNPNNSKQTHLLKPTQEPYPYIKSQQTDRRTTDLESLRAASSMADTSTSSNISGSPITHLAQDHLFTILLLLPIDSILSFAMTCKRFRVLTSSDTLWESLFRRDWGPTSVDVLKSSYFHHQQQQIPWMRLYKQVYQLDYVSCHKLSGPDAKLLLPNPRASHSLNFVSDCLVLFGGGSEGGRHLDDTWVAYLGNGFQRMSKWQKVNSGIPSGRFGHSCVVIDGFLILFGGINDLGNRQNDTWVGQVACHENLGITLSWRLLEVGTTLPPPRGAHAACCIEGRRMVVHGGMGLHGVRIGDTWVLELSENFSFGIWYEIVAQPSPPPRSGHTLTCIEGTQSVLFGGRGLGYDVLNDVWLLDSYEGHLKWLQILYELPSIPEGVSIPRVGHSATRTLGGRLLIYGGEDSNRQRKDDFWLLDISAVQSIRVQPARVISKKLFAKMWKRVKAINDKPKSRSFHRACTDHSGRYLYIFGGMVDGVLQPAESSGLMFDSELFLVELVL